MVNGRISIIVPVYNAEKHLEDAIKSVLEQTYSEFELIAVNDGSTDRSLEILQQFTDQRVRIINKENTGVSDARNAAIKAAKGEFVCFLDADDYYSPHYIQRMYETAMANDADMVVCNYMPFRGKPYFSEEKSTAVSVKSTEPLVQAGVLTSAWTKLIRTSTLSKYSIYFEKNMSFGEDLFFCWKAFLASENVWMIDEKLYGYRMTDSGATSKYHPELYEKYKEAFTDLKAFGKNINKNDEYTMDVFFATRMPSFILMTVREKCTLLHKRNRLLHILEDNTIQSVYKNWKLFLTRINVDQIAFYEKCRKKQIFSLLIYGYKRNIITLLKNKIKGLL